MILRALVVCAAVLITMPASAQSPWDKQNDPFGSSFGSQNDDRDRDRGYGTRRYDSPGTSLMAPQTSEPWRQQQQGDSLMSEPNRRYRSDKGRSLLAP